MKKKSLPSKNLNSSNSSKKSYSDIKGFSNIIEDVIKYNKSESSSKKKENVINRQSAFDKDIDLDSLNNQILNSNEKEREKESIDENLYNNILKQLNQELKFDNQNKILTNNNLQNERKKYEKKEDLEYDKSIIKHLEIEIILNNNLKKSNPNKIIEKINEYFNNKEIYYYEYSNTRNISTITIGTIDNNIYESYYKKEEISQIQVSSIKNNETLKKIKIIDYISTLYSVYNNAFINKQFFYIINPMHCYYFDMKEEKLYLSNVLRIENILNENEIMFKRIEPSKEEIEKIEKNNQFNLIKFNEFPVIIDKLYMMNFFNVFINNGSEVKNFNIYSPFQFEGSFCRKCKIYLENFKKENNNIISINIYGILFENNIREIIHFLKEESKCKNFSIKFNKILSTESFYKINKNLKRPIDKFEYKDSYFFTII